MKLYDWAGWRLHLFLALSRISGQLYVLLTLNLGKSWVGYRATLDTLQKRKISWSAKEWNHDSSTSSPWTINYTDCVSQLTEWRVILYEVLKGDVLYIFCNKRFYLNKCNIRIRRFTTHWLTLWPTGVVNNGK